MPNRLILVDHMLWLLVAETGLSAYDFDFEAYLPCSHPWKRPSDIVVIPRLGAFDDYERDYERFRAEGIHLIHSPTQHFLCSELPNWYPALEDLTPHSRWYREVPTLEEVASSFGWPVFVKGVRQTSRHRKALSILEGPEAFEQAMQIYREDPILRWQGIVCREYVPLRPVGKPTGDKIPPSFEFRTFWWKGTLVGCGRYWWEAEPYGMTDTDRAAAMVVAEEAARRIAVPFLVVDIAQTHEGHWIVIECNDALESGYAGTLPLGIWQGILECEKRHQR